jgi:hypothetical protein
MKCLNSAFNAQGSSLIIVVVQVGAVEALREKERQDVTQFTTKIGGKLSLDALLCRFVKFSFSFQVTRLMPYYAETGHSCHLIMRLCR